MFKSRIQFSLKDQRKKIPKNVKRKIITGQSLDRPSMLIICQSILYESLDDGVFFIDIWQYLIHFL